MTESGRAVFLSYASEDTEAAARLAGNLLAAGIEVWFDRDALRGGDAWDRNIREQIQSCRLFIPIISAQADARYEGYFRREWKLAVDRTHDLSERATFIVPVVIDATHESVADVPAAFRAVQWTRLRGGEASTAFVARIAGLLDVARPLRSVGDAIPPAPILNEAQRSTSLVRWALAGLAVLFVIGFGTYTGWRKTHRSPDEPPSSAAALIGPPSDGITAKSIAVLPFVDLSEKHDQGYFADGLAEEILDQLARLRDLRVIARASSFSFRDRPDDIPTIAHKLRVATILEGSVRRSESRVKVTTDLILAKTGERIWSDSYERDFKDVFSIQSDVASSVARALKATLVEHFDASSATTTNAEAYDLALQGIEAMRSDSEEHSQLRARDLLSRAVELDPEYANAWARLAQAETELSLRSDDRGTHTARALKCAQRAIELRPDLPIGYVSYARSLAHYNEFAAARVQVDKALQIDPNDAWAISWAGMLARFDGNYAESLRLMQRSLDLDPENLNRLLDIADSLAAEGRLREADTTLRRLNDAHPKFRDTLWRWASVRLAEGDPAGAFQVLEGQRASTEVRGSGALTIALERLGRREEAAAAFRDLEDHFVKFRPLSIAEVYAEHGNRDSALLWLERALAARDPNLINARWDPLLAPIRGDARFTEFLDRLSHSSSGH